MHPGRILKTAAKAVSAVAPSMSMVKPDVAFRCVAPAELASVCKGMSGMFSGVRDFSSSASSVGDDVVGGGGSGIPPTATKADEKPSLTPQEEAKRDHAVQVLYVIFVQLSGLNDGMHNSGARHEVVSQYYSSYSDFEKSVIEGEITEPFSTLADGTKIFSVATECGVAMLARHNHKVVGRMFIGSESSGEKHLSILSSLAPHELEAVGVKKSPEFIASELLAAYRSYLEKEGTLEGVISKRIKISCIGDYRDLVYAITDGQPDTLRKEDNSLKREIPMRSLLDGASEILAGKVVKPKTVTTIRDFDFALDDQASKLYGSRSGDDELPWR